MVGKNPSGYLILSTRVGDQGWRSSTAPPVAIRAGELQQDFDIRVQLCNSPRPLRVVHEQVRPQPDEYQHTDETKKTKEDFLGRLH